MVPIVIPHTFNYVDSTRSSTQSYNTVCNDPITRKLIMNKGSDILVQYWEDVVSSLAQEINVVMYLQVQNIIKYYDYS